MLICNTKGMLLHQVKSSDAMQNYLLEHSLRAMAELSDREFLVTTQSKDRFLLNLKTESARPLDMSTCYFRHQKIIPLRNGKFLGAGPGYFIKYDPATNTCEETPIANTHIFLFDSLEQGKVAFSDKHKREIGVYDISNGSVKILEVNGEAYKVPGVVHELRVAKNGILWVATTEGLLRVDLDVGVVEVIGKGPPFTDPRFLCIDEDDRGRLWLGTPMNGIHIYDPATKSLQTINSEHGLGNNTVVNITADEEGMRWAGTYNGISLLSPEGKLIANFYEEDGVVHRESNRYANLKSSDGKILIGSVKGLTVIDPQKIKENLVQSKDLKVYLTKLEYVAADTEKDTVQRTGLKDLGTIALPAAHRDLNIHFAVSNYFRPGENKYAYLFEGEDTGWTELGNQPHLNLKNLPAGNHRLLIRGGDGVGNWTNEPIVLNIEAKEFFYKTTAFYVLCGLLLAGVVFLWIFNLRTQIKRATQQIRKDKETIEQQAEKLKELDQAKSKFFTNISHEFRTPLTIISGMIDQVKTKPDIWLEKGSEMIKQNTLNLLNLINQILDLRKLESKNLTLVLVQGDMVKYLRYLIGSYQPYAENKGMKLHFLAAKPSIIMDYDPDKMLRIVSNLLSNAIKYNKEKGDIYFQIEQVENHGKAFLQMRVQDTGKGIPKEKLPDIFGRFFQVNEPGKKKVVGSGIGLALTHELVDLMKGTIEVASEVNVGTTFLIKIPITRTAEVKDTFAETPVLKPEISPPNETVFSKEILPKILTKKEEKIADLPHLLIVEDNPDIVQILIACLEENYHLQVANNGRKGIDKAIEQVPDLIVSDVMMPEKDGFELTDTLKNDERTSHIPIILLTAKSDLNSKISGLEKGADAYLAKPFEQKELLVRLRKLLELRQKLQAKYQVSDTFKVSGTLPTMEDIFIQKVRKAVEDNMEDEDFGTVALSNKLRMSRAQVHNKIKALTGKSTSHFVRSIHLQKAKELLQTTDLNISEIGYEVGFKNPSHFSRVFLEEFGESPKEVQGK